MKILTLKRDGNGNGLPSIATIDRDHKISDALLQLDTTKVGTSNFTEMCIANDGRIILAGGDAGVVVVFDRQGGLLSSTRMDDWQSWSRSNAICFTPDQSQLFYAPVNDRVPIKLISCRIGSPNIGNVQPFGELQHSQSNVENPVNRQGSLCVDTNGWLYVATSLGVQVLDQAGRVNFIIPTPQPPHDLCFGGKDLSELFIACGGTVYKRKTKAKGYISGQMAPIKPPAPKL